MRRFNKLFAFFLVIIVGFQLFNLRIINFSKGMLKFKNRLKINIYLKFQNLR
jgi:hypothetical protein